MADLLAIYQELGLPGLVPHALRDGTYGHQMLVKKIKSGDPLFFVSSHMNAPFILVKNGEYQTYVYTNEQDADRKCKQLAGMRYNVGYEEIPGEGEREAAFQWFFDYGPTSIFLDESLSIPISRLAKVPDYDGQPNDEHMLRNRILNGAIFYYLQIACAQMSNMDAEQRWAKLMFQSLYLLMTDGEKEGTYALLEKDVKGTPCFLLYTDWQQVQMDYPQNPTAGVVDFDYLFQLLQEHPDHGILLNQNTCHLLLNPTLMDVIRQIAVTSHYERPLDFVPVIGKPRQGLGFGQVSEEEWDKVDPTPDWLK